MQWTYGSTPSKNLLMTKRNDQSTFKIYRSQMVSPDCLQAPLLTFSPIRPIPHQCTAHRVMLQTLFSFKCSTIANPHIQIQSLHIFLSQYIFNISGPVLPWLFHLPWLSLTWINNIRLMLWCSKVYSWQQFNIAIIKHISKNLDEVFIIRWDGWTLHLLN